ncbi:LacI family DNA-binding transcriptional regulator [Herbaspirillum sp.]|uniref:LacI family DNA-binding transcriptional regulator n=1 Tax=Herbaspirillum sp. TaxID=1890675 RepID=UPI0031D0AE0B
MSKRAAQDSKPVSPSPQKGSRATGRVTITDVAAEAGVSSMTVSRALKTPALVQEQSRERIFKAIDKLGYVPNQAAATLASARSQVIGVLVPSLTNAVFIETLSGIRDYLAEAGYQFLIGETGYARDKEAQLIATYLAHAPAGFLLSSSEQYEILQSRPASRAIPAVRMFDLGRGNDEYSVGFSQTKAGYAVARHLAERGYRRPAFIAAQLDPRMMKRREGFRKGLQDAGIDPAVEVLLPLPTTVDMGAQLLRRVLETRPDCDAVFCCNDDLALGALFECQRQGIAVPGRLAIAGFNDLSWAACATPSITTVITPRYDIGYKSAEMLIRQLRGEEIPKGRLDLGFELAVREST